MEFIVIILAIFSLVAFTVATWLAVQLHRCRSQPPPPPTPNIQTLLADLTSPLIRDQDPLGSIVKFMHHYETGQASSRQGYTVCNMLIQTLNSAWRLNVFAQYQERVPFDETTHRVNKGTIIKPGTMVIIIEPGWRLKNSIIKYPLVTPVNVDQLD